MENANHPTNLRVFKNEQLNAAFNKYGYVVVDFLTHEDVKQLQDFYVRNPNPAAGAFHTTHFAEDKLYKKKIHDTIASAVQPQVSNLLVDYLPIFGNYMVKEAGGNNPMPLHADWTYVDEGKNASISIWIPLVDTTEQNGCIGVIPFSQHLSHSIRGPRILQWEFPTNDELINALGKLIPMQAGQALIYNHRLLHYSPPNNSGQLRPAVNLSLVPKGEIVIHYTVPLGEEKVHRYEVPSTDFYIYYDNFKKPELGNAPVILEGKVEMLSDRSAAFIKQFKPATGGGVLQFFKRLLGLANA